MIEEHKQDYRDKWYEIFDEFHKILKNVIKIARNKIVNSLLFNNKRINNFAIRFDLEDIDKLNETIDYLQNCDLYGAKEMMSELFKNKLSSMLHEKTFKEYLLKHNIIVNKNNISKNKNSNTKTLDYFVENYTYKNNPIYLTLKHGNWCGGGSQDSQKDDVIKTLNYFKDNNNMNIFAILDGDYYNHSYNGKYKHYLHELQNTYPNKVFNTIQFIEFVKANCSLI